jgi:hypothetical protein
MKLEERRRAAEDTILTAFNDSREAEWVLAYRWRELDNSKESARSPSDPDVAILTIDNDDNPDEVPPWMKQKGYTFPVLLDDGYVAKAGVTAFPTTWFIDRDGRKVFVKTGWSEKLLEEFGWRIEAVRSGTQ